MEKELTHEQKSSIELHRNAKGEYSWRVKIYCNESTGDDLDLVRLEIDRQDGYLREKYGTKSD